MPIDMDFYHDLASAQRALKDGWLPEGEELRVLLVYMLARIESLTNTVRALQIEDYP